MWGLPIALHECLARNLFFSSLVKTNRFVKIRLGIIGTGDAWQSRHEPALRMLHDRFDVRAVFSPTARLAENIASDFQADVADGFRAMVQRCDIDAVMVLGRTWLGWLPMLAAADAGKAIYWAGPCEIDPTRDAQVLEWIDKSGVSMMVEFPKRYAPSTLRLKELLATHLGPPKMIFCHRRLARQSNSLPELIELIDWCRYVVGRRPVSVVGTGHQDETGQFGSQNVTLHFPEDQGNEAVTAEIRCSRFDRGEWPEAMSYQLPPMLQIVCAHGIAYVDLPSTLVWFDDAGRHIESLESETPVGQQLLSHFHRAVTSLLRNVGDLDDAFLASRISSLARQSHAEGRRIEIDDH